MSSPWEYYKAQTQKIEENKPSSVPWEHYKKVEEISKPSIVGAAVKDVGEMAGGLAELGKLGAQFALPPLQMYKTAKTAGELVAGKPMEETALGGTLQKSKTITQALPQLPGTLAKTYAGYARHPLESFREHPVQMALDVAPALAGAGKLAKLGALGKLAGGVEAVGTRATPLYNKALSAAVNVPEKSIAMAQKIPGMFAEGTTYEKLAVEALPKLGDKFKEQMMTLAKKANETLSSSRYINEGAISKDAILKEVQHEIGSLGGAYSSETKLARKALTNLLNDYSQKLRGTVSQKNVKYLIEELDNMIPWKKQYSIGETFTKEEQALIGIREKLDNLLKYDSAGNPTAYGVAMKPLKDAIVVRNEVFKKLGIKKADIIGTEAGKRYVPSDVTTGRLRAALKEGRPETSRILGETKQVLGEDLMPQIEKAQALEDFSKAQTKVPFLGNIFKTEELAKTATALPAKTIDRVKRMITSSPQTLGIYAPLLQNAARLGDDEFTMKHWVLSKTDPNYQDMIHNLSEEQPK